jgi:hypothetical protein
MPSIIPNVHNINAFLCCLGLDPDERRFYEVRMLHPDPVSGDPAARRKSRWFPTTLAGLAAATAFVVDWNAKGSMHM